MKNATIVLVACGLLMSAALVPAAEAASRTGPVTVAGIEYDTFSDYFRSDTFQQIGARCGTPEPDFSQVGGAARSSLPPFDCNLQQQVIKPEYHPDANDVCVINVVVHVIESVAVPGWGEISDQLVQSQIDILNEDLQALAGTPGEPGQDCRIVFQLATVNPQGQPMVGITRSTNEFWFNDQLDPIEGWYYDALAWDPHRYLNIYTLSPEAPGGVILGYVPFFPSSNDGINVGTNEDRVVILWNSFGRNSGSPPYDQGRTATHEVGHYLGLYHTFQGACGGPNCNQTGDRICDTEPEQDSRGGCPGNAVSCGTPDPVHNYMDYTNDTCMWEFTFEQSHRIRCTLTHWRSNLCQDEATAAPVVARSQGSLLLPSRPNPFTGETEIGFSLTRTGDVTLQVLDVTGRVVRTLTRGSVAAGRHTVRWDGTSDARESLAAGVYFYRIETLDGSETRRMTYVK